MVINTNHTQFQRSEKSENGLSHSKIQMIKLKKNMIEMKKIKTVITAFSAKRHLIKKLKFMSFPKSFIIQ